MSSLYNNFRDIKQFGEREKEIQKLLSTPGVENKINAIAATLASTFSVSTKLLHDLVPGDEFVDTSTKITYVYEATLTPFDISALCELIFSMAKQPYEQLTDQGYFSFRQKGIQGSRHVMSLRDFIKCLAVDKFKMVSKNKTSIDVEQVLNL